MSTKIRSEESELMPLSRRHARQYVRSADIVFHQEGVSQKREALIRIGDAVNLNGSMSGVARSKSRFEGHAHGAFGISSWYGVATSGATCSLSKLSETKFHKRKWQLQYILVLMLATLRELTTDNTTGDPIGILRGINRSCLRWHIGGNRKWEKPIVSGDVDDS